MENAITAGIVNVPLTKPAKVFFITNDYPSILSTQVEEMFKSLHQEYCIDKRIPTNRTFITSKHEIESNKIKIIFRNFKTLRPHLDSKWRYLFWEIDDYRESILSYVTSIYRSMDLPVYGHKSMRGYHFICLKPIPKQDWILGIKTLRHTNLKFPPTTLRLLANKYPDELEIYREGFIITNAIHKDTIQFKKWVESQDIQKISQQYWVVWYPLNKLEHGHEDNTDMTEVLLR